MTIFTRKQIDIRIYAVAASLLVSLLTILFPDTLNDDAYIYIRTAEIFLADGLTAAFQHYAWASYSVLIALISQLGFSLFTSAFILNAFFFALLVYSYISIIMYIDDSRRVLLLAAICILLYPQINEYRYLIIRDVAFWSLALFALWQYLSYTTEHSLKHACAFSAALIVAISFRLEAAIYLLVVPFTVLLDTRFAKRERQLLFLKLAGVVASSSIVTLLALTVTGLSFGGLLAEYISTYQPFLVDTFNPSSAQMTELAGAVFGEYAAAYSKEYILLFLFAGLLPILVANLFNAIGGPFFWILLWGFFKKTVRVQRHVLMPLLCFVTINTIILFAFLYLTRYLSSRYAQLLCLVVALLVPLIVTRIIDSIQARAWGSLGQRVVILFFGYLGFDSFVNFADPKDFISDSVAWIEIRSEADSRLITNNRAIAYYTGKIENYDETQRFLTEADILSSRQDDLIAIEMYVEMTQLVSSESLRGVLEFQTAFPSIKNQRVAIYRRTAH
ncbi:MAG: hypothetical protein QGG02_08625 [Gammaproteobacteria bacterium]|nr:hypothetical protein [Gammaproteobacteria bacterium]MDP6733470.1 hypothetical protein [Gammaproteobacteria bacterium]